MALSVIGSSFKIYWASPTPESWFWLSVTLSRIQSLYCRIVLDDINTIHFLASLTDGLFELAASYAGCNAPLVGTFFGAAIAMHGLYTSCAFIIPNDLSPNHASTISAMMYVLGATVCIFVPIIFARLAPNVRLNDFLSSSHQDCTILNVFFYACSRYGVVVDSRMETNILDYYGLANVENSAVCSVGLSRSSTMELQIRGYYLGEFFFCS